MSTTDFLGIVVCAVLVIGCALVIIFTAAPGTATARPLLRRPIDEEPDDLIADPKATDLLGLYGVYNRQGIGWQSAPLPPERHRCRTWTKVITPYGHLRYCPCGGSRLSGDPVFIQVNSHRERTERALP